MGIRLKKRFAILLFCCLRQAERSVHYAVSTPSWWDQFLEYYDAPRRQMLRSIRDRLYAMGARRTRIPQREDVDRTFLPYEMQIYFNQFTNFLLRPLKRSWRFTEDEVTFFAVALDAVDKLWDEREPPLANHYLVKLRTDISIARDIMEIRMAGIPQIKKAMWMEHFCCPDYFHPIEAILGKSSTELLAE